MKVKYADIKFLSDCFRPPRFPLAGVGRRTLHYDDIEKISVVEQNGVRRHALDLTMKHGRNLRLDLVSESDCLKLKEKLEEIISPKIIHDEKPLPLESLPGHCRELIGAPGQNHRKVLDFLISQALCRQAGDLTIDRQEGRAVVSFKIDGVFYPAVDFEPDQGERIINCLKTAAGMILYRRDAIQEGRITKNTKQGPQDIRVSVMPSEGGERAAVRLFDKLKGTSSLEDLGFSTDILQKFDQLTKSTSGLYIICGPAGSGKTTTLYALLRRLKKVRGAMAGIIALEDPVEYRLEGITQIQVEHGGALDFANVLKSCLRQDPGVLMVGEIRDAETADAAVRAALTGHLVLSSLHCGRAAEAPARLSDLGVRPFLLNSALKSVFCQRLVRKICPHCAGEMNLGPEEAGLWETGKAPDKYKSGAGCEQCRGTGYLGRTAMAEYMVNQDRVSEMIAAAHDAVSIEQAAVSLGMTPLFARGLALIENGGADPGEIRRVLG